MASAKSQTYKANCHCGLMKYTVEVTPPLEDGHEVVSCDCSICTRDGKWNIYIPKDKIQFVQGEDSVKLYKFLTLTHAFCPECGTSLYCHASNPNDEFADERALNVRAFHGLDMSRLKVNRVSMKSNDPEYNPGW